ncbi:MAG: hypothetical protein R2874_15245 [Desulfobacterales bacterium]
MPSPWPGTGLFLRLLTVAQHYGLPTRFNGLGIFLPYVALHFATENLDHFDVDGVIWVVNFHAVTPACQRNCAFFYRLKAPEAFTVELLASLRLSAVCRFECRSFLEFVVLGEVVWERMRVSLFFEPPSIDDRIINQFALFYRSCPIPVARIDHWLRDHPEFFRRIIIPAELKWECRDKLDQCNITERLLLPGLGGLCTWLKRHYSLGPQVDPQTYSQG